MKRNNKNGSAEFLALVAFLAIFISVVIFIISLPFVLSSAKKKKEEKELNAIIKEEIIQERNLTKMQRKEFKILKINEIERAEDFDYELILVNPHNGRKRKFISTDGDMHFDKIVSDEIRVGSLIKVRF